MHYFDHEKSDVYRSDIEFVTPVAWQALTENPQRREPGTIIVQKGSKSIPQDNVKNWEIGRRILKGEGK